jgi:hypothetical protein
MTTVSDLLFDNPPDGVAMLTHELETANVLTGDLVPAGDAAAAILDLLDTPVGGLIASAWDKFGTVQKACAETRAQPGSRQQVRVGHHSFQSIQHPRLEAEIDNKSIPLLTLDLALSLTVDGVVVTVAAGRVVSVALADTTGEIKLNCGDVTLAKRAVTHVVLPHVIERGEAPTGAAEAPSSASRNP